MATEAELDQAAGLLRRGGLVALPTETVYGLCANALDPGAVARIYQAKGRPPTSPLIVHVCSVEMARGFAAVWPAGAETLAMRYWPGPLTIVVEKREHVPDIVTAGLPSVGLRMPSHPVMLDVIRRAGLPLAAPSANPFMALSPTTAAHVRLSLGQSVDLVLDGGPCQVGIESTVVSLVGGQPVLLRPGIISREQLEATLGEPVAVGLRPAAGAHPSPGMHQRHYCPKTPVILARGGRLPPGRGAYLRLTTPAPAELEIAMPLDAAGYARSLYAALHKADEAGLEWIAVESPPLGTEWDAIRDRLQRAAGC